MKTKNAIKAFAAMALVGAFCSCSSDDSIAENNQ